MTIIQSLGSSNITTYFISWLILLMLHYQVTTLTIQCHTVLQYIMLTQAKLYNVMHVASLMEQSNASMTVGIAPQVYVLHVYIASWIIQMHNDYYRLENCTVPRWGQSDQDHHAHRHYHIFFITARIFSKQLIVQTDWGLPYLSFMHLFSYD